MNSYLQLKDMHILGTLVMVICTVGNVIVVGGGLVLDRTSQGVQSGDERLPLV